MGSPGRALRHQRPQATQLAPRLGASPAPVPTLAAAQPAPASHSSGRSAALGRSAAAPLAGRNAEPGRGALRWTQLGSRSRLESRFSTCESLPPASVRGFARSRPGNGTHLRRRVPRVPRLRRASQVYPGRAAQARNPRFRGSAHLRAERLALRLECRVRVAPPLLGRNSRGVHLRAQRRERRLRRLQRAAFDLRGGQPLYRQSGSPPFPPVLTGHVSSLPPVLTGHVALRTESSGRRGKSSFFSGAAEPPAAREG